MKKQYENNIRKGGIAEEIAILKQRREARKEKEEKKNAINPSSTKKEQDQKFLKMITQKKQNLFKTFKPLPHIDSFHALNDWINSIKENIGNSCNYIVIANKIDDNEKRVVPKKEAIELAKSKNVKYFEISALKGLNVYEILKEISWIMKTNIKEDLVRINSFGINETNNNEDNKNNGVKKNNCCK